MEFKSTTHETIVGMTLLGIRSRLLKSFFIVESLDIHKILKQSRATIFLLAKPQMSINDPNPQQIRRNKKCSIDVLWRKSESSASWISWNHWNHKRVWVQWVQSCSRQLTERLGFCYSWKRCNSNAGKFHEIIPLINCWKVKAFCVTKLIFIVAVNLFGR